MSETTNRLKFQEAYLKHLKACIVEMPQTYAYPVTDAEKVSARMFAALDTGSASVDSHAFKRTCKELGIKHTRKEILEYWKG